jgi:hypothetical protein
MKKYLEDSNNNNEPYNKKIDHCCFQHDTKKILMRYRPWPVGDGNHLFIFGRIEIASELFLKTSLGSQSVNFKYIRHLCRLLNNKDKDYRESYSNIIVLFDHRCTEGEMKLCVHSNIENLDSFETMMSKVASLYDVDSCQDFFYTFSILDTETIADITKADVREIKALNKMDKYDCIEITNTNGNMPYSEFQKLFRTFYLKSILEYYECHDIQSYYMIEKEFIEKCHVLFVEFQDDFQVKFQDENDENYVKGLSVALQDRYQFLQNDFELYFELHQEIIENRIEKDLLNKFEKKKKEEYEGGWEETKEKQDALRLLIDDYKKNELEDAIQEDFDRRKNKSIKSSLKEDFIEEWKEKFKIEVKKFLIENNIREKIEFKSPHDENEVFVDALSLLNNYELLFFKLFKENHIRDYEEDSVHNSIRLRGKIKKAFIEKYKRVARKNHYERIFVPMILYGQTTSKKAEKFMEVIKSGYIMESIISNMLR